MKTRDEYTTELKRRLAANLRYLRIKADKTQAQVCEELRLADMTLRRLEHGLGSASLDVIGRLAHYFQISDPVELFAERPMPLITCGRRPRNFAAVIAGEREMRPMKPATAPEDLSKLTYPLLASVKLDGVRAMARDGQLLSAALKLIPNAYVQSWLGRAELHGLDGELIVGDPTHPNCMQNTTSGVMRVAGEPLFTYYVFDYWDSPRPFRERLVMLEDQLAVHDIFTQHGVIKQVPQVLVESVEELMDVEQKFVGEGYEGVVLRCLERPYKFGRSTLREQGMIKLKRFYDAEAEVIGFEELMHNANEATVNALGLTERSSHQANKHGLGVLGSFIVRDLTSGVEFKVGAGMTQAQRLEYWRCGEALLGRVLTYKSLPVGVKDKPRHPVFKGFRHAYDLSE